MRILELVGFAAGALFAPIAAAGSYLRRARIFHPDGLVYRAEVTPLAETGPAREVADRLSGPALVRLSSAIFRRRPGEPARRPDLLGLSIRFRSDPVPSAEPEKGDQDLLFATVRSAFTLLPDLLTTHVDSFLFDEYHTLGVFDAGELRGVKLRLATPRIPGGDVSREEALEQAVAAGMAVFELQAREAKIGSPFQPIAKIRLVERVNVDQAALRFSPFRAGRGVVPRGFLHATRIVPYPASQLARSPRER